MTVPAATILASLYGLFMGTYPVPIKTKRVLAANVHPIVFQCYKSTIVFLSGLLFLIPIYARGDTFRFTWWGVASAACWVPGGFVTITAVPLIGVSLTIVISCSTCAVGNFLVYWLVLGEKMKEHEVDGTTIYLAPLYLAMTAVGMVGLVYAPKWVGSRAPKPKAGEPGGIVVGLEAGDEVLLDSVAADADAEPARPAGSVGRRALGLCCSTLSGVCAAAQYAVQGLGKRYELAARGCATAGPAAATAAPPPPPPSAACDEVNEMFDAMDGGWLVSFGVGALLMAALGYAVVSLVRRAPPPPQLRVTFLPGCFCGTAWILANFCGTVGAALERRANGGDAVTMTQMMAVQLVVSGLWGIFYYREIRGRQALVWSACALWTLVAMALLGLEKAN